MAVGLARADKIFYGKAKGLGNPVLYFGSKTGRDGIHGATMASAEFDEESESKRPTVQVGDPFTEKLLLEACLELMSSDVLVGIQDMGAAGLTSSSVEMAARAGNGIELDLDQGAAPRDRHDRVRVHALGVAGAHARRRRGRAARPRRSPSSPSGISTPPSSAASPTPARSW